MVRDGEVDELVRQLLDELRLPVVVEARRIARVEQLLDRDVRHRPDDVDGRRVELAERPQQLLAALDIREREGDDADHMLPLELRRNEGRRRSGQKAHAAADLVWRVGDELAVEAQHIGRLVGRPEDHAAGHQRRQLVQAVLEARHDAEIAAAATQAPEQVGVLLLARPDGASVRGHDVGGDQVVRRVAVEPLEPAAPCP